MNESPSYSVNLNPSTTLNAIFSFLNALQSLVTNEELLLYYILSFLHIELKNLIKGMKIALITIYGPQCYHTINDKD